MRQRRSARLAVTTRRVRQVWRAGDKDAILLIHFPLRTAGVRRGNREATRRDPSSGRTPVGATPGDAERSAAQPVLCADRIAERESCNVRWK